MNQIILSKNIIFLSISAIFLANHPAVETQDFERIDHVICGAAPLGGLDEEKLKKKAQKKINVLQGKKHNFILINKIKQGLVLVGYGLTETSPCVLCTRRGLKESVDCPGSLGIPVPNTQAKIIDIDDKEGKPLGPNQKGIVAIMCKHSY